MAAAQPIEVSSYARLVSLLRARVSEVQTTFAGVDSLAGLPDRYAQKLLGHEPVKGMGAISLFPILQCLGLRLVLVPDPPALAKLQSHALWASLRRPGPRYRPSPRKRRRSSAAPNGHAGQTSV